MFSILYIYHAVWLMMVHKQATSKADCNQGKKRANSNQHKEGWFINSYSAVRFFLITEMSLVKDDVSASECESFGFLLLYILWNPHLRPVVIWKCPFVIIIFFFTVHLTHLLSVILGKWFRVPRHSGSHCGRSGRKCSSSSVQRRPGHETSWQSWPGSQIRYSFFLWPYLYPHNNFFK